MKSLSKRYLNKHINVTFLLFLSLATFTSTAMAGAPLVPPPPDLDVRSYVLMDPASGQVLAAKAENERLQPASLTKLMTAYLTFDGLQRGTLKMDESVPVSTEAWKTGGSRMFIEPKLPVTVNQLIQGLVVVSGNDAAVALSEAIGGSSGGFVQLMNSTAHMLGMNNTHYADVNGLPDPNHYSSAYDIALLSRDIIEQFPQQFHFFGEKTFTYNNITQKNWNPLVFKDPSVDGMKTGHTEEAGFCLDTTAVRQNRRLIAVVLGAKTRTASAEATEVLLNYGYRNYESDLVAQASQKMGALHDVHFEPMTLAVGPAKPFYVSVPIGDKNRIKLNLTLKGGIQPEVAKGQVVGTITATVGGQVVATAPAVALNSAQQAGFLARIWNQILSWV